MTELNLKTETKGHELIKKYLEENVSDILANKINNGVKIVKDGKTLINKKDLFGFMGFATDEARKIAAKGENSACIEDEVVYGWAIHYFEEDSIEGTLYNEDGTEFKTVTKTVSAPKTTTYTPPVKKQEPSLFDLLEEKPEPKEEIKEEVEDYTEEDNEPINEIDNELESATMQEVLSLNVDTETGEIKSKMDTSIISPFFAKYIEFQNLFPNAIIAYKLGDFYEFLGDNARVTAEMLELTLTGRDVGLQERIPMCGIPYHAMEPYMKKLSQKYNIVLVENDKVEKKIPTFALKDEEDEVLKEEQELMQAVDKNVLIEIMNIFGNDIILE